MWIPQNTHKISLSKRNPNPSNAWRCSGPWESPWISQSQNKSHVLACSVLKWLDLILRDFFSPSVFISPVLKAPPKTFSQKLYFYPQECFTMWKECRAAKPHCWVVVMPGTLHHTAPPAQQVKICLCWAKTTCLYKQHLKGSPTSGPTAARPPKSLRSSSIFPGQGGKCAWEISKAMYEKGNSNYKPHRNR